MPIRLPNQQAFHASAEVVEGRARTKENVAELYTTRHRARKSVSQGLRGVREVKHASVPLSKVGAVCGSAARTDLCGGRSAMAVPTATHAIHRIPVHSHSLAFRTDHRSSENAEQIGSFFRSLRVSVAELFP